MKKLFLSLGFALIIAAGIFAWTWYRDNKMPNFSANASIYVFPDDSCEDVINKIKEQCQVLSERSLRRAFKSKEVEQHLSPGFYRIDTYFSSVQLARTLNNAWQSPVKLTLSGTLRSKGTIASKIAAQMLVDSASVHKAMEDEALLESFGLRPESVFALFLPDTYEIYWTASVEEIFRRLHSQVDAFWTEENLQKAKGLGLDREKATILASIVKGESNYTPELPLIAGVYLNRLTIGMPLQADPTIAFCYDYKVNRILRKHLEIDSPYNTYKHKGLPPAPICSPNKACLEAVLNPDYGGPRGKGNLYFCANSDFSGSHLFAKTYSQHKVNARAFQKELTRRQKAKNNS